MATTSRRPEHALLCECARSRVAGSAVVRLPAVPIDWAYLLATAEAHAVTELLLAPLKAAPAYAPGEVMERLERRLLEATALNLARARQLAGLLRRFGAHGIRALAFKGPPLAVGLYGHVGLRSSADLDVLVDRRDASRVRPLMLADGYTLPARDRHRCGSLLYGLYRAAGRTDTLLPLDPRLASVDVHIAFAFWTQGIRLDLDGLFDRATMVEVAGEPIPTLCADDLLLVLAIHGLMHGWGALRLVSDIDAVARQVADWGAVVRRARSARMLRALRVALLLGHDVLEAELPPRVLELATRDRGAVALAASVIARLFDPPAAGEWDPGPWFLAFQERPRDRMRFHARRLIYEWFLKWPWDDWLGRRSGSVSPKQA